MWFRLVVVFLLYHNAVGSNRIVPNTMSKLRDCIHKRYSVLCLKETALDAINETILSDEPINFYNMVKIERNPEYHPDIFKDKQLPEDHRQRSRKLNNLLYDMVEEFFRSRVVRFNMVPALDEEGRKKGGGGGGKGKGGVMMLVMGGMACMIAQMMIGKVAFLAGSALIIAKMALFMSSIIGIKKLVGGGGGGSETSHVVYAGGGDYGHSHGGGGGGWHRSLEGTTPADFYREYDSSHVIKNGNGY